MLRFVVLLQHPWRSHSDTPLTCFFILCTRDCLGNYNFQKEKQAFWQPDALLDQIKTQTFEQAYASRY